MALKHHVLDNTWETSVPYLGKKIRHYSATTRQVVISTNPHLKGLVQESLLWLFLLCILLWSRSEQNWHEMTAI